MPNNGMENEAGRTENHEATVAKQRQDRYSSVVLGFCCAQLLHGEAQLRRPLGRLMSLLRGPNMVLKVDNFGLAGLSSVFKKAAADIRILDGADGHRVSLASVRRLQRELVQFMSPSYSDQVYFVSLVVSRMIDDMFDNFFGDVPYTTGTEQARVYLARKLSEHLENLGQFYPNRATGDSEQDQRTWIDLALMELRALAKNVEDAKAASNQQYLSFAAGR